MLKNYIKIALRNLQRHKIFSFINIAGLTIGIACCTLLLLYIKEETGYDRHHAHAQDLYRITTSFQNVDGLSEHVATSSPPIAMGLLQDFPEVVNATRVVDPLGVEENLIQYGEKSFFESKGLLADSTFFQLFHYEFAAGNPETALQQPNSVVVTQTLADKIFGRQNILGEVISIGNTFGKFDFKITGILENTDKKSHIEANFFTSITSQGLGEFVVNQNNWAGQNFLFSYIQLYPEASPEALEAKLPALLNKYGAEDLKALGIDKTLHLQPVQDIHLKSHYDFELGQNGSMVYIYVLSAIAAFLLLIACINFMNLSTAQATRRASEVGVRKTLGASQSLLILQFFGEAILIVMIAVLFSIVLVSLLLPFFNSLIGKNIDFHTIEWPYYVLSAITLTIITSLLAGAYPAFFLSSFQPAKVLKGKVSPQLSGGLLRKVLVVFQFVIAICLISGMIIIMSQLDYMRQQELGFNATSRVVIPLRTQEASQQYEALEMRLNQQTPIQKVSASSMIPGRNVLNDFNLYPEGSAMENGISCQRYFVDDEFVEVLDMQILNGRNFDYARDKEHNERILINLEALRHFGIVPEEAVGKKLFTEYEGDIWNYEIIGVINDFHQQSLHQPIYPMVFHLGEPHLFSYVVASVSPAAMPEALKIMESSWKAVNPDLPFEYIFLDERVQKQYESDQQMAQIIGGFTFIAILISCLGLYGLSAFVAERKVKEIGIRKVLGAEFTQIVSLLSRDFTKLVIIAILIAVPLSYYIMYQWLQNFAYRTAIEPQAFIMAGLVALLIAWLTISYHSIRAALINPVESLKNE